MFSKIYQSTLKNIVRSTATKICCIFTLIAAVLFHSVNTGAGGLIEYIATVSSYPFDAAMYTYLIAAVIFPVSLLYDYNNSFYEIEVVTGLKKVVYFLSKALAYFTFFFVWMIVLILDIIVSTYISGQLNIPYPFIETFVRVVVGLIYIGIPCGVFSVGIAMALAGITKRKSIAISVILLYCIYPMFLRVDSTTFVTYPPNKIFHFLATQTQGQLNDLFPLPKIIVLQMGLFILIGIVSFILLLFVRGRKNSMR